jgi:very-short-patch-repair endonuclease
MSLPEVLLWQVLRHRPAGLKFRRQFPLGKITADFACLEARLIVEIDGASHSIGDQPRRDSVRDAVVRRAGFDVMRIAAMDVLNDMDAVLAGIIARCSDAGPLHHAAARRGPPPRSGEDFT